VKFVMAKFVMAQVYCTSNLCLLDRAKYYSTDQSILAAGGVSCL
jgi:hypothetical protein